MNVGKEEEMRHKYICGKCGKRWESEGTSSYCCGCRCSLSRGVGRKGRFKYMEVGEEVRFRKDGKSKDWIWKAVAEARDETGNTYRVYNGCMDMRVVRIS